MRLEAVYRTGRVVAEHWGSDPNLRAEIKQKLADEITMKARMADLIDYVVTVDPNGNTIITASLDASSTGDERRAASSQSQSD